MDLKEEINKINTPLTLKQWNKLFYTKFKNELIWNWDRSYPYCIELSNLLIFMNSYHLINLKGFGHISVISDDDD